MTKLTYFYMIINVQSHSNKIVSGFHGKLKYNPPERRNAHSLVERLNFPDNRISVRRHTYMGISWACSYKAGMGSHHSQTSTYYF